MFDHVSAARKLVERRPICISARATGKQGADEGSGAGRDGAAGRASRADVHLGAIGPASAWLLAMEFFGWRAFRNRRELAALAGLVGTPYNTGDSARDQGISKAGNRRVRAMIVEIAWLWLRFQPKSALSQWYRRRFGGGGLRMRRIGIVALARKLLIALWRYLEQGLIPGGARLIASEL
jgi:transposase